MSVERISAYRFSCNTCNVVVTIPVNELEEASQTPKDWADVSAFWLGKCYQFHVCSACCRQITASKHPVGGKGVHFLLNTLAEAERQRLEFRQK